MAPTQLLANYASPTSTQTFSSQLPPMPRDSGSVEEKTTYLAALRASASKIQGEVNAFLTKKMDEDNAAQAGAGARKAADEREEEMYGEEDPENDGQRARRQ